MTDVVAGNPRMLSADELNRLPALASQPAWRALLHAEGEASQIQDAGFFSPGSDRSLLAEIEQSAHQAKLADPAWVCRFPARALWLSHQLGWPKPQMGGCADLQEFLRRAPLHQLDLVFASETLSEPSSMMGHIFLKVSGRNDRREWTQHAITFYTDANTWNIPKLFIDSTLVGKEGHFALSPYADQVDTYVRHEQRGVWEYRIKLTDSQRELIQMHIWELRQTGFLYFFQRYNCATLVNYVLALAGGDAMLTGDDPWLTPKDVVKRAHGAGLIGETTVLAPASWLVRHLNDGLNDVQRRVIKTAVETSRMEPLLQQSTTAEAYLSLELAQAYNQYLRDERRKSGEQSAQDGLVMQRHRQTKFSDAEMGAAEFKNPVNSPPDTQWSVGLQRSSGDNHLLLRFLPVSHGIDDDNRNYLSENALKLLEVTVRQTPRTGKWRLEQLEIYSIQSYLPVDPLMGGLSGQFRAAASRSWMAGASDRRVWHVEGAVGKTWRVHTDVDLFALVGGGAYWRESLKPLAAPQMGMIVREVFDMKTRWQFKQLITPDLPKPAMEMELTQTKQWGKRNAVSLGWIRRQAAGQTSDEWGVSWRKLY